MMACSMVQAAVQGPKSSDFYGEKNVREGFPNSYCT